jgi:hypothetical protein
MDKDAFCTHVPHIDAELDEVLSMLNVEIQLLAGRGPPLVESRF